MSLIAERFIMTGIGWNKPSLSSQISYRYNISQFEKFLNSRNKIIQDGTVTSQDILDYTECIKSNHKYKQNTVYSKIASISSYLNWLKQEKILTQIPAIKLPKQCISKHKKLSNNDINTITQSLRGNKLNEKRNLAIFLLIIRCGIKVEEIVATNVKDVDFENAKIITKNRKYSFRAAFIPMKAYDDEKRKNCLNWNKFGIEHEHFFINKNLGRLGARTMRKRLMFHVLKLGSYDMRDLQYTYLQNTISKGILSIVS